MNGCENNMQNGNSKDHCVNGKIFQTAKEIYIHTGNLTNWSQSHSKVVKNTTEEVNNKGEIWAFCCVFHSNYFNPTK